MNNSVDPYVVAAIVAVLATCVGGLIWVIKHLFNNIVPALGGLRKATDSNTKATKMADSYLRHRNGRDAELAAQLATTTQEFHVELMKSIAEIPKQIIKSGEVTAKTLRETPVNQAIERQEVATQVINGAKK